MSKAGASPIRRNKRAWSSRHPNLLRAILEVNMTVRVLWFGALKEMVKDASLTVEMPGGADVASLLDLLIKRHKGLAKIAGSLAIAVNQHYVPRSHKLSDNDEVALLPPVSGGAIELSTYIALTRSPINVQNELDLLVSDKDGALCTFTGAVRNHSKGRATLYLDYEAYEEMAKEQLNVLVEGAKAKFAIQGVLIIHRLGRLQVGEASVLIGVSAPHRDAAFQACRWLIDTLKQTVPIWKKEHFTDGAAWAEGEPFPAAVLQ